MISEGLQQKALDLIAEVEAAGKAVGRQEALSECAEQLAEQQANFDAQLTEERKKGYIEGYNARKEEEGSTPVEVVYESMTFPDGAGYSGTEAKIVDMFSYSRVFKNTKWGTIMLPVALDYDDWKDKFEIAEIVGVEAGASIVAKRKVLGVGSQTEPNRPYLIRAKESSSSPQKISKERCIVFPAVEGGVSFVQDGKNYTFQGSYHTLTKNDLVGMYYSKSEAFVPATGTLKPMRVCLKIEKL